MTDNAGVAEAVAALRAIGYYLERDQQPTHRVNVSNSLVRTDY